MEFEFYNRFGVIRVVNKADYLVAAFRLTTALGEEAFQAFCDGLTRQEGASLFDGEAEKYVVGTVEQMQQT